MMPLSSTLSAPLLWTKSNGRHELKCYAELAGTLSKPSFWNSLYHAEAEAGAWTFRPHGLFGGAEILDGLSHHPIARFSVNWSGGTLTFADGDTYSFESYGCWHPALHVVGRHNAVVLRVHSWERTVDLVNEAGLGDTRLALLTLFAWYRVQQGNEEAASVSTLTACAAAV